MEDRCLFAAEWLELRERTFAGRAGREGAWTYVRRRKTVGAVCAVATRQAGDARELLLVRQYRHPVEREVLEFPAGLVDAEEDPRVSVLRELKEETGWTGELERMGPPVPTSPGLTDEAVAFAHIRLIEAGPQQLEGDEVIVVEWAPVEGLLDWLTSQVEAGILVDARVWAFACGLAAKV
ncbi:MAG: NUDIX hydrolase [Opitutales bacterium]|nr:NUDIX hydrolase [Opitutales bacterium]